jgi:hypothetical protein
MMDYFRQYLIRIEKERGIPRFFDRKKIDMLNKFIKKEGGGGGYFENQYYYLYHIMMFFNAMYLKMSYHYHRDSLHIYSIVLFLVSALVCYKWKFETNLTWLYFYLIMTTQLFFMDQDLHLPRWFILYPVLPMMIISVLEDIMIILSSDPDTNITRMSKEKIRENKWKMVFIDIFNDNDVRFFYPLFFEVYMSVCALFCIKDAGIENINCFASIYMIMLWSIFLYTESKKSELSSAKMFYMPNPVVKIIFLLYSPPEFWLNISILVLINILMIQTWSKYKRLIYTIAFLLFTLFVLVVCKDMISGTCPIIEF